MKNYRFWHSCCIYCLGTRQMRNRNINNELSDAFKRPGGKRKKTKTRILNRETLGLLPVFLSIFRRFLPRIQLKWLRSNDGTVAGRPLDRQNNRSINYETTKKFHCFHASSKSFRKPKFWYMKILMPNRL